MQSQELLSKVVEIVEEAGQVLLEFQPKVKEIKKEGKDFLTDADIKSNSLIYKKIQEITPEIPIYSEEDEKGIKRDEKIIWIIDPLDGTINFFHQDVFWGLSVVLVENQQSKIGVVYLPALNQLAGVTQEGKIITKGNIVLQVNSDNNLSKTQVWTDWSKDSNAILSIFPKIAKISFRPQVRLCSSASFMAVATGRISAYIYPPHPVPEDIAAACLIVEKAGGRVTNLDGNPWTPFSDSIVASNEVLHNQILKAISG